MSDIDINEKFDCEKCTEQDKMIRNCNGDITNYMGRPVRITLNRAVPWMYVKRCPKKLINAETLELWQHYQWFFVTDHLPYFGGYLDQPVLLLNTFEFCKSLISKIENDRRYVKWMADKKKLDVDKEDNFLEKGMIKFSDIRKRRQGR